MKTTSTTTTPVGVVTTIRIDGEAVARFFGSGSAESAKVFDNAANLAAENKRLEFALEIMTERLRELVSAAERIEPQIVRGGLREEQDFKAARLSAAQFLKGGAQ